MPQEIESNKDADRASDISPLLALIREARDLLDGEIGDSDPIDSDWDVEDYPIIGAFQKLNEAEALCNVQVLPSPDQLENWADLYWKDPHRAEDLEKGLCGSFPQKLRAIADVFEDRMLSTENAHVQTSPTTTDQ